MHSISIFNQGPELVLALVPILLDAALKSVLVLAVAGAVVLCMKRCSAAARHLVWCLAVAGLLGLPVLSWALPGWHVLPHWMQVPTPSRITPPRQPSPPAIPQNLSSAQRREIIDPAAVAEPVLQTTTPKAVMQRQPARNPAITQPRQAIYWQLALAVWFAGAALALLTTLLGLLSLWRLQCGSRRETGSAWLELLRRLVASLSFRRSVALLKTARRRMPMTWGILRPKLLLPEESQAWPEERRRVVLLHELAHAKRWDYLTNLITQLACALYWFNPFVWLAARQMVAERERACDDSVLRNGAKPADYAEQVLQIAAGLPLGRFAAYSGIAMARPSRLEDRLRAILDTRRNRASVARWLFVCASVLLVAFVLPVAMIKAAPAESPKSEVRSPNSKQSLITPAATNDPTHPFVVTGLVTDEQGRGLEGVTLTAHCGMGTLWQTGETQTDAEGCYTLRFREGMRGLEQSNGQWRVSLQAATISPSKPGFCETNLHRGGDLLMADKLPAPGEDVGWKWDLAKVVLPNQPHELNFVMRPAATVTGQLLGERDQPMGKTKLWINGTSLPPSSSVLAETETDADGGFHFDNVPTGYLWRFNIANGSSSDATFTEPALHKVTLRVRTISGQTNLELQKLGAKPAANGAESVGGLSVQLTSEKPAWELPEQPVLSLSVRNNGSNTVELAQAQQTGELEVDGVWYTWATPFTVTRKPLAPGTEFDGIRVVPDAQWRSGVTRLVAGPGKHTFRFAVVADRIESVSGGTLRAISNPVLLDLDWSASLKATMARQQNLGAGTQAVASSSLSDLEGWVFVEPNWTRYPRLYDNWGGGQSADRNCLFTARPRRNARKCGLFFLVRRAFWQVFSPEHLL